MARSIKQKWNSERNFTNLSRLRSVKTRLRQVASCHSTLRHEYAGLIRIVEEIDEIMRAWNIPSTKQASFDIYEKVGIKCH